MENDSAMIIFLGILGISWSHSFIVYHIFVKYNLYLISNFEIISDHTIYDEKIRSRDL